MNATIYKQNDSRWASLPYPTKSSSFGGSGCGCCACTHIAIEQSSKKSWTPKTLRTWMVKQGYAVEHQGTKWSGITETLKHIGHTNVVKIWSDPMSAAWKELNKGNRIGILLVDSSKTPDGTKWTASGHYVAFVNYKVVDGQHWFYIKDSGARNHDGWFCYEKSLKGALPKLWIVKRIKETDPLQAWYDAMETQFKWSKNQAYKFNEKPTVTNSKKEGTCITFPAVSLQRLGLLPSGKYFYYHPTKKKISGNAQTYVKNHTELFSLSYPHKTIAQLGDKIQKGDIVGFGNPSYHTMVYMGKNSNGKPVFNTMGHRKGLRVTYSGYANRKIDMLVRLKKTGK